MIDATDFLKCMQFSSHGMEFGKERSAMLRSMRLLHETHPFITIHYFFQSRLPRCHLVLHEDYRLLGKTRAGRGRQGRAITAIVVFSVLLLSIAAWFSLVFSFRSRCWQKIEKWEGSPLAFRWEPFETPNQQRDPVYHRPNTARLRLDPNSTHDLLSLNQVVFGIAGSVQLWSKRKEFVKLWWRPDEMRGHVWLEEAVLNEPSLPPVMVSEDISRFTYTNPTGHPSGLRISRIIQESFSLGLPNVKWFVLGDDDTIFNPENLINVLRKYDPNEMYYIGSPSESHSANTYFSHSMAFGGGGIAISYPLAEALSKMQDECLERYSKLFGSDDRLHACISELGVPLTGEPGFHQWDIRGNAYGLLSTHPIAPFVSIHHLEAVEPIFPQHNSLDGLRLLSRAMRTDPGTFLQRSICYDRKKQLTFSVSMGYVVQVFPKIVLPRELERSERTYIAWNKLDNSFEFDFDTRPPQRSPCKKPFLFFLEDIYRGVKNISVSTYKRDKRRDNLKRSPFCFSWAIPSHEVQYIRVVSKPITRHWYQDDSAAKSQKQRINWMVKDPSSHISRDSLSECPSGIMMMISSLTVDLCNKIANIIVVSLDMDADTSFFVHINGTGNWPRV
eukprot:Gb_25014 [translate_table: standard]